MQPARLELSHKTLSKKPRYRRHKEYVENELYSTTLTITRTEKEPFPPSDVTFEIHVAYTNKLADSREVLLPKGSVTPEKPFSFSTKQRVTASGFALFSLGCSPYEQRSQFADSEGRPIEFGSYGIDNFHAVSNTDLATIAGLYLAAVGTILAALGLILTAILR